MLKPSALAAMALAVLWVTSAPAPAHAQSGTGKVLSQFEFTADTANQWKLPRKLDEVSGLMVSEEGRVFAHEDEHAIVYELDLAGARLKKAFALGAPVLRGDFEGIAGLGGKLFLITSSGRLYRFEEGSDGAQVAYDSFETGAGEFCEVEGLDADPAKRDLLIACKQRRPNSSLERDVIAILRWSATDQALQRDKDLIIPLRYAPEGMGREGVRPSGIALVSGRDRLLIVAAAENVLLEVSQSGDLVYAMRLPRWHRQAEGLALSADGALLIADEGGRGRGRLTVYPRISTAAGSVN